MGKIKAALSSVHNIKNWPTYFFDYLSIAGSKDINYVFKDFVICARGGTSDRGIMTSIILSDEHKIKNLKLPKNAVVVDIGAQIGIFSVYVASKAGKVYAYEPEPKNYAYILKNIQKNKMETKIVPINLAVSDKKEKIRIFYSKENTGAHSRFTKSDEFVDVQAIPLKDIFDSNKLNKVDLLKIDTEGSEYKIIFGLPDNYFKKIDRMVIECHDIKDKKNNKENLIKFLRKKKYFIRTEKDYLFCKRQ